MSETGHDTNIYDIARLAGVSISTVSRVLNNHPDVSARTRQKVQKIFEEYSYIPNNSARNLSREPVNAIGVVIKGFDNPFFQKMLGILQTQLDLRQYTMLLHPIDPHTDEIEAGIAFLKEKKVRGLIFLGAAYTQSPIRLAQLNVPFVIATIALEQSVDQKLYSSVAIDNYAEIYTAAKTICNSGHQKIAAIGDFPGDNSISELRIRGFQDALSTNGISVSRESIAVTQEFSMAEGYRAARELLSKERYTCLFCMADVLALGAMRAIQDMGLSVPGDVSVIGVDGIEAGKFSCPRLATVEQPAEQFASESLRILMDMVENSAQNRHLLFPTNLYLGESFRAL